MNCEGGDDGVGKDACNPSEFENAEENQKDAGEKGDGDDSRIKFRFVVFVVDERQQRGTH